MTLQEVVSDDRMTVRSPDSPVVDEERVEAQQALDELLRTVRNLYL